MPTAGDQALPEDQALRNGLAELGMHLSTAQLSAFQEYSELLQKWNRSYNLIAADDLAHLHHRHLLDSLSVSAHLHDSPILDVGTGAGLPGIPLAIANPDREFVLLDSNGKKTRFLFQVKLALGLDNVRIENCRVEHYQSLQQLAIVTCRAFAPIPDIIRLTEHLLSAGTTLLAMKGRYPEQELAQLPDGYTVTGQHQLQIPGDESQRHLVCITRTEPDQHNRRK